jgi:DNA-binding transcriptional LysR family regulator
MTDPVEAPPVSPDTKNDEHKFSGIHWDDLNLLLHVIRMGSFHRAADVLGLTQPTVSRRIARLERALGTSILTRMNNGVSLTLDGQALLDDLGTAQAAIERIRSRARAAPLPRDSVKLITTDGLAAYWLPHFLPHFFDAYPNIELRMQAAIDARGRSGEPYDMSVHYLHPSDPDLFTTRLGTLHFIPFASQSYLDKHGTPRSIGELGKHRLLDFILYLIDKGTWSARLPDEAVETATQLFTNSSAVLAEAVRGGAGIALLPTYGALFNPDLIPLEINMHYETAFWLCYRKSSADRAAVRTAIQFMKHIFNHRTMPWFGERYIPPSRFAAVTPNDIMKTFASSEISPFPAQAAEN